MQIQITDGVPLRLAVRCRRRRRRRSHTRHLLERVSGGVTDTFDLTSFFSIPPTPPNLDSRG